MCETQKVRKEKEAKKGSWGSSWEHEDCRNPQKRNFTMPGGLYRENDLDSRYQAKAQNRPYRKRDCGYWDLEQTELSCVDSGEANGNPKDRTDHGACDGCGGPGSVDYGALSPVTKEDWLTGSPRVTWEAGGCGKLNGYVDYKNLNYNPEDSKKSQQWTGSRSLDNSLGNLGQPQNWYMDHRNFNYTAEDCEEINFYYRDFNDLYHAPGNYTNGQSVDFSDLNGFNEGGEFSKYRKGDRNAYQNDEIYPKARTHTMDRDNFDSENKGCETMLASCESKPRNSRGTDSPHHMEYLEYNGIGKPGMVALGDGGLMADGLQNRGSHVDQGERDTGISQSRSLENTRHSGEAGRPHGPETWRRNSCLRRTAPSTLRRSEFVQNRKKARGRSSVR